MKRTIGVLGAGSWGTAIAMAFAESNPSVMLWDHDASHCEALVRDGENARYLPGIPLPSTLGIQPQLSMLCEQCNDLVFMVPSHFFEKVLQQVKPYLTDSHRIAWGTKGLDAQGAFLSDVVTKEISFPIPMAVLAGPSFAREVAQHMPTAVTVASPQLEYAKELAKALTHEYLRVYTATDMIGVQLGGAAKNVLAIATGISDGLGFGANTRAALMTRGLSEMMRLGLALGGETSTFMGLAGVGDLILTCTDDQSRNRRFGLAMGRGDTIQEAFARIDQVVEGYETTLRIFELAKRHKVEIPIMEQVYNVLYKGAPPRDAVMTLMSRPIREE